MRAWFNLKNLIALSLLWATSGLGAPDSTINMTPGVTPMSQDIYYLHMTIFWICVVIGVIVFSALFYSLVKYRKSRGVQPAKFHGHTYVEVIWAVVPTLILILMAIPATRVLMRMEDSSKSEVNIKVTGYQWKWKYEYLDEGISFFSNLSTPYDQLNNKAPKGEHYLREVDNPLVVPIHKKIRFLVTSNDVVHSWWVPAFGIKRDAIPGFIHEAWARIDKPGIYRGQCAELCGIHHGFMPIVVDARTEADYETWVNQHRQQAAPTAAAPLPPTLTKEELLQKGENIYNTTCAVCHKPDGSGMPPAFPALKGGKIAVGPVAAHIEIVLHGKSGTAMQAFSTQLSDTDIAEVVTYERNSWGNADSQKYGKDAGGLVQPVMVQQMREGKSPTATSAPAAAPTPAATKAAAQPPTPATTPAPAATQAPTQPAPAAPTAVGQPVSAPQPSPGTTPPSSGQPATAAPAAGLTKEVLLQKGENVYNTTCAVCHKPDGSGTPPTFPALKGSKIATGPVANHIEIVVHGKSGTAMQAFGAQLSNDDIAAAITYERNSWGNADTQKYGKDAGGIVQPDDIAKAKGEK
ncbi:MAG: cytochrome c oxidase subunit II [Gammaproteobacteria bacterium]